MSSEDANIDTKPATICSSNEIIIERQQLRICQLENQIESFKTTIKRFNEGLLLEKQIALTNHRKMLRRNSRGLKRLANGEQKQEQQHRPHDLPSLIPIPSHMLYLPFIN